MAGAISWADPVLAGVRKAPFGAYRRAIRIAADGGFASAEMEDDVHHFGITLEHAEDVVVAISGSAWRTPWSICPGALHQIEALRGGRLGSLQRLPPSVRAEHCLHLLDLVLLAANHAGKSGFARLYRVEGDFDQSPPLLRLWRDGTETLSWSVNCGRVQGSAFDGLALKDLARSLDKHTADEAEAARVLWRASLIAPVRTIDLDAFDDAVQLNPHASASCYARQPLRSEAAARNRGSSRDFYGEAGWPLE